MYKLYIFNVEEFNDNHIFEHFFNLLSDEQKESVKKYAFRKDQNISLGKFLLLEYFFPNQEIKYENNGKPYLVSKEKYFNISHSGDYILIGISDENIGVDVQKKSNMYHHAKKFFSQEEQKIMKLDNDENFVRYWSLKESYFKYEGTGLTRNNKDYINLDTLTIHNKDVCFYEYGDIDGYEITVCLNSKQEKQKLKFITLNDFLKN